jgi:hypothetical protein
MSRQFFHKPLRVCLFDMPVKSSKFFGKPGEIIEPSNRICYKISSGNIQEVILIFLPGLVRIYGALAEQISSQA